MKVIFFLQFCLHITESKFHTYIERHPLRNNSPAWQRVESSEVAIPAEMEGWVRGDEQRTLQVAASKDAETAPAATTA